jgi:hypothetical protein
MIYFILGILQLLFGYCALGIGVIAIMGVIWDARKNPPAN